MEIGELIAEFVALNSKAKSLTLNDQEFTRWVELKETLISAIDGECVASPAQPSARADARP
jgi:hypothetical protein